MIPHTQLVTVDTCNRVAYLTLHAPPANCYSHEMMLELDGAILETRFDEGVDVIVLTGQGTQFFCAGADVEKLQTASPAYRYHFFQHANETLMRLENTPKLVIAAINGNCIGGGLEVALSADVRVARRGEYKLGFPKSTLDAQEGTGGTQRLARLLGKSRAIQLLATGETFGPEKARSLGLLNDILPEEDFREAMVAYAEQFTSPRSSANAIGLMKRGLQKGPEADLQSALALESKLEHLHVAHRESNVELYASLENRPPLFTEDAP